RVSVDLTAVKYYGVSLGQVVSTIRSENVDVPGGSIDAGAQKYLLRVGGRFENPERIEDLVVARKGGRPIYVRDLAE
ncbi:MAG: efflux RND transporter permease subunit, partial [Gemmatimonadota bacterium]